MASSTMDLTVFFIAVSGDAASIARRCTVRPWRAAIASIHSLAMYEYGDEKSNQKSMGVFIDPGYPGATASSIGVCSVPGSTIRADDGGAPGQRIRRPAGRALARRVGRGVPDRHAGCHLRRLPASLARDLLRPAVPASRLIQALK